MAEQPKRNWGTSQATYLARLEGTPVKVAFMDGKALTGVLSGVDTYEVFIKPSKGPEVMIAKGAIKYVHPVKDDEGNQNSDPGTNP
ncbi:MAG: RNA chaperone Hfq [Anaerolineae bacterium]|nr:RNA chaperone Hfq [Anaerolineae bacterium]